MGDISKIRGSQVEPRAGRNAKGRLRSINVAKADRPFLLSCPLVYPTFVCVHGHTAGRVLNILQDLNRLLLGRIQWGIRIPCHAHHDNLFHCTNPNLKFIDPSKKSRNGDRVGKFQLTVWS